MKLAILAALVGAVALATAGLLQPSSALTSATPAAARSAAAEPTPSPAAGATGDSRFQPTTVKEIAKLHPGARGKAQSFHGALRWRKKDASTSLTPAATSSSTSAAAASAAPYTPLVYNGLNANGTNAAMNCSIFGSCVAPPDSTGAIGPNHYVEMSNTLIEAWSRNLVTTSSGAHPLYSFLGFPITDALCDPQVQWDAAAGRWLYSVLVCAPLSDGTFAFMFGWSKTSDPSNLFHGGGWCTDLGIDTGSLILDYPKLGHNSSWMIIAGNFYSGNNFQGAGAAWIQLPANGVTSCPSAFPTTHTTGSTALTNGDGSFLFTPVPVNTDSSAGNGYIVSAYDPTDHGTGTPKNIAVWHVDAGGGLHHDSDVPANQYDVPRSAPQPLPAAWPIDTLDGRLTQAVGDPVRGIWTQHTISPTPGGKAQVIWYELVASGTNLVKAQEGTVVSATDDIFNAAISPSWSGDGAAIFYNRTNSTTHPVIAGQVRRAGTPSGSMAGGEVILASSDVSDTDGSCNFMSSGSCRWGDYSGASPDPVNTSVIWGTNEFVNTAITYGVKWMDENFAVYDYTPPSAPLGVGATPGDGFACVSWSAPALDAGTSVTGYTITAYQGASLVKTLAAGGATTRACVTGLTNGVAYTFTVTATNAVGIGDESAHSGPVTPSRAVSQSTSAASSARTGINPAPPPPSPPPRP